jgi:hypothetical protein
MDAGTKAPSDSITSRRSYTSSWNCSKVIWSRFLKPFRPKFMHKSYNGQLLICNNP